MSKEPGKYDPQPAAPQSVADMKRRAHILIEIVAKRPGSAKLLTGVLTQLEIFSQYKNNRKWRERPPPGQ